MPTRLDRYVIGQILGPFGVFALILLALVWLSQSLRVVETVVASGQSALIFAQAAALLLPQAMAVILPVAAFAATLHALNRLRAESELTVMAAAGMSGLRLARPVAVFGLGVTAAMAVITLGLMPQASRELRDRMAELGADLAGALLREGEFIHPAEGVTVYVRATAPDGQMAGLFVQDDRDPDGRVTYTAERAALVRTADGPRLVMFDGAAQRLARSDQTLTVLRFDKLVYDLASLAAPGGDRRLRPSEYRALSLIRPTDEMVGARARGEFVAEGHEQISAPLYALVLPLIAAAVLQSAGHRRRGGPGPLLAAVAAASACRLAGVAAKSAVGGTAALWPLMYLAPLLGGGLALWLLWRGPPRGRILPAGAT